MGALDGSCGVSPRRSGNSERQGSVGRTDGGPEIPELDFLEVGDLQVIRERLDAYREAYGDACIVHDVELLLDRLERCTKVVFSLIDRAPASSDDR